MKDLYVIVVALTVAAHFVFIGYLVIGGFLALRWPRTLWLNVLTVAWGVGSVALHFPCPLTGLERWARAGAGMNPLPSQGFIGYYITGVLYPAGDAGAVQILVFATVLVSWAARVLISIRRRTRRAG